MVEKKKVLIEKVIEQITIDCGISRFYRNRGINI